MLRGHLSERGLVVERFENTRFQGAPSARSILRHINFSPSDRLNSMSMTERSSLQMTGWLYAPRAGKYQFAVTSNDRVWFRINNKRLINHRPDKTDVTKRRIRLAKGYHPVRIRIRHISGDSDLRFQWRLPSGYMNLEAIPPSFLHPEQPTPSDVGLVLKLVPLLFVLAFFIVLFWQQLLRIVRSILKPNHRQPLMLGVLIFVAALGVRLYDLNAAGETADEWAYASAGRIYISNLGHGDLASRYWHANEEHPPIGKYIYGLVSHLAGTDSYTPLRMASAVMNALVVLITFMLGYRYFGLLVGMVAGGILVTLPHFLAHGKVAALDSPSTFLATVAIAAYLRGMENGARSNRWYLTSGVMASLAAATKFSNVLLFVFMVAAHVASQWRRIRQEGLVIVPWPLFFLPLLPVALLVVVWPWLWENPFGQLVATLTHWDYPIREWFLGAFRQPPPHYYFVYFFVTLPTMLLIPLAYLCWTGRKQTDISLGQRSQRFWIVVFALWFVTPFIWTLSVLKQDGIRYIYNMYPPLAILLGLGTREIACMIAKRASWSISRTSKWVGTLVVLYTAGQASSVHPYYLDYYTEWSGGTYAAWENRRFEVGWWGQGMNRAVDYVNAHAKAGDTWECYGVVNHTVDGIRTDIKRVAKTAKWLIVGYVKRGQEERKGYKEVHRISLQGAPLAIVYLRES